MFHARERKHIKLVRLHLQKYEKHLAEVQKELAPFEQQYGISSEECYQRFMAGEMGDAADITDSRPWWTITDSGCTRGRGRVAPAFGGCPWGHAPVQKMTTARRLAKAPTIQHPAD
jgi:hypothetical protein